MSDGNTWEVEMTDQEYYTRKEILGLIAKADFVEASVEIEYQRADGLEEADTHSMKITKKGARELILYMTEEDDLVKASWYNGRLVLTHG